MIWVKGRGSGLDKRQCTVQITLYADGKTRVKPMIIFRGKGKRISFREKVIIILEAIFNIILLILLIIIIATL